MIVELGHYALVLAFGLAIVQTLLPLYGAARRDQALIGVVTRISMTEYIVRFQVRDARDGQVVSKTRKVMVKAGLESRVDFRDLAAAAPVGAAAIVNR